MSTIQQLKNFIRHGKQARVFNDENNTHKPDDHGSPQLAQKLPAAPELGIIPIHAHAQPTVGAYSVGVTDGQDGNGSAQAGHAVPHHAEANLTSVKTKNRRIDDANIAKLIAEENESRKKFPTYAGLERWVLLEKMGDGAFSNVYRARDTQGQYGEVAIKVVRKYEMNNLQGNKHLHPDFKKIPRAAERANILKEVQIMRQLDHPNIVKLVDFSESKQFYYIILELAQGGELFHQIVRLTYFSEDLSRHVIVQVAKALEYLHEERGVVHRDIKPENILFNPVPFIPSRNPRKRQPGEEDKVDEGEFIKGVGAGGIGHIKIADFGLSKIVWDNQTMTPCGTVGYTAPEIVKDERYSKSVDMWALGCVLYTLLCGFPPFYDESIEVLTEKVAKGQYTFLSPWWDDISKASQDLISHLLAVDPERRYTIREFLNHPWIRASGPTPREEKRLSEQAMLQAFDRAQIVEGDRRCDFRSPGVVNLREVFDVGYAVHRQEEAKRRKQIGKGGGGGANILSQMLGGVNEESEDDVNSEYAYGLGGSSDAEMADAGGEGDHQQSAAAREATRQLEQRMREANLGRDSGGDTVVVVERGRKRDRQPRPQDDDAPVQVPVPAPPAAAAAADKDRGYGQHSAAVTAAARQQVRERNRGKGAFELNLEGATLLGRRGMKPTAKVA